MAIYWLDRAAADTLSIRPCISIVANPKHLQQPLAESQETIAPQTHLFKLFVEYAFQA